MNCRIKMGKKDMPIKRRASRFKAMRTDHRREAAEDYTELVYELIQAKGEARTGEIARQLGISHVTAVRTIQRLQEQGYLETARHKPVELTAKGLKLALHTIKRHRVLVEFFVSIGVPLDVAESDVEGAEHHISAVTLEKIIEHMKQQDPDSDAPDD